jgi:hypothetical protein
MKVEIHLEVILAWSLFLFVVVDELSLTVLLVGLTRYIILFKW